MTPPVIGILGGGQLGRMLQEQAALLGIELAVLDAEGSPARQIKSSERHVTGSFRDGEKIRELARRSDVLTVEIEHVDTHVLEEIATKGIDGRKVAVHPSWQTLRLIQDKFLQKEHFRTAGLPVAPQVAVDGEDEIQKAGSTFGYPFLLKSRKESYDGRGNFVVKTEDDIEAALKAMPEATLYAEKFQPFVRELAVMVLRTEQDDGTLRHVFAYPAVETVHQESVCTTVFYPPRETSAKLANEAADLACDVVRTLSGRGVYAVELFVLPDDSLVVNEVAPRPHNSGHYTIEAVPAMSQYKGQLCALLDVVPDDLQLTPRVSSAIMVNVLGGVEAKSHERLVGMTHSLYDPKMDVFLHLYGKESKPGRKIGHITATAYDNVSLSTLATLAKPLIDEADRIRQERLEKKAEQMRPATTTKTVATTTTTTTTSRNRQHPLVVVTMGSDSDLPVLQGAFAVLERFHVPYDYTITSAHRTPQRMSELATGAAARGVRVLIAAAGGAAALPGMLASETPVPVIGVPVKATHLDGKDSLLSIVQMPRGCPVATVGINNSTNAGLLAVRILGTTDASYQKAMAAYMAEMREEVHAKAARLEEVGYEVYLKK